MNKEYLPYVSLGYRPSKSDLICKFYFEPAKDSSHTEAAGAIAAESSTGTWTELTTIKRETRVNLGAKVFEINNNTCKIAYPAELFEPGNMPQIFSSIAGNIFGMKEINNLRLLDIDFPKKIADSFKGPLYGIQGVRKLTGIKKRPLVGTIIKPKLGLNEKQHAKVAYEAWVGGLDAVKDDENLSSQPFNNFYKRVDETLKMKRKAEKETGEHKVYMCNVTAETKEMLKRAKYLKDSGNDYLMVDILTVGWAGLQTLRDEMDRLKLVMHGHRAMHAALTRNPKHGIAMDVIAKASRLVGLDQLHIGAGIGKMEGDVKEVQELVHVCEDKLYNVKPTFAVCSGGLYPGTIPALVKLYGKDIIIQAGGGVHGNPFGTRGGATAMRDAVDAAMSGKNIYDYAKNKKELKAALDKWGAAHV
ncbi:MAG: type III ribulose-bisphosphate carboxylase [Candidatus Nanoarchaeia archaeon]|nr:type III ribulose-bisphosphate carboxylase [Candidatus Nanoarchaeia archaeon]MDD5239405.1 type III ribulose-bisphosphate carboxylase [Candidatus Nanoarchaeia archaeon]